MKHDAAGNRYEFVLNIKVKITVKDRDAFLILKKKRDETFCLLFTNNETKYYNDEMGSREFSFK